MSVADRQAGEPHEGCTRGGGVFMLQLREKQVGVTTAGILDMPVFENFVTHVACDMCGAMDRHRDRGALLTKFCERLLPSFISASDRPNACQRCPGKEQLVEVYLPHAFRDNRSGSRQKFGTTTVLCLRCGQLVWSHNHSAAQDAAEEEKWRELGAKLQA